MAGRNGRTSKTGARAETPGGRTEEPVGSGLPGAPPAEGPVRSNSGNATADHVLNVISLFNDAQLALTANDIAEQLQMSRSRCYRYLASLLAHGLVEESTKEGEYRLGQRIFELARLARRAFGTTELVLPVMEELAAATGASVLLSRRSRDRIVCLERVDGPHGASLLYSRGDNLPLNASASAKVLLAYMEREEAELLLSRQTWTRFTENTPPDAASYFDELRRVRQQGYSTSEGETVVGIKGVAAPVFDSAGEVQIALSIGAIAFLLPDEELPRMIQLVTQAAAGISDRLRMLEAG